MKLFTKYNLWSLTAAALIFLFIAISAFYSFRGLMIRQLDKSLMGERDEVLQYIDKNKVLPEAEKIFDERTVIEEEHEPYQKIKFRTKKKSFNSDKEEMVRAIYFGVELDGKHYRVTVMRSLSETNNLLGNIVLIALATLLMLLLLMYIINRALVKKLFRPFYKTLDSIEKYKLTETDPIHFQKTSTYEFNLLNEKLSSLSSRIISDYMVLKEFSANAAHEMQTPLAVIRNHVDHLLQSEDLPEEKINTLQKIESTVGKLSRLNQSLLILTRLESNPHIEKSEIQIDRRIETKLKDLSEIIEAKKITVEKDIIPLQVKMNEQLWEIISNNLLNNAIRYNVEEGRILIATGVDFLEIRNTSPLPALEPEKIFTRFYRHPANTQEGTGLGLAITRQAVHLAGYGINYQYENGLHVFRIDFHS